MTPAPLIEVAPTGRKALGLQGVPHAWVPPFFTLSPELYSRWLASPEAGAASVLKDADRRELEQRLVAEFGEEGSVIVRSNGAAETIVERGRLESFRADTTVEGVLQAIEKVFSQSRNVADLTALGVLIQAFRHPEIAGHLSNERRVAEDPRRWVCEFEGSPRSVFALRVEKAQPARDTVLVCPRRRQMLQLLRSIGHYYQRLGLRRHLEWVWDGAHLWVVQCDEAPNPDGRDPADHTTAVRVPSTRPQFRVLRHFTRADASRWQKLRCAQTFKHLRLPTTPLFVLSAASEISRLAADRPSRGVQSDIEILCRSPIVIRSDIAKQSTLLAPRTDRVTGTPQALSFLSQTARDLLKSGVPASDIAFIIHRYIPARASAFSLARPSANRVRVDALWGLPDGLNVLPHDSFELDRKGRVLDRRVRFKPKFLCNHEDGSWKYEPIAPPADWRPSIPDSDLARIAEVTTRLADHEESPIQLMWFVDIPAHTGHPSLLPWRYTTEEWPQDVQSAVAMRFSRSPAVVRTPEDLQALRARQRTASAIQLEPTETYLRKQGEFLEETGKVAQLLGIPVDLEGSVLSHAYYILSRTGAQVRCVDLIRSQQNRQEFRKLVRDKIPVIIERHGEDVRAEKVPDSELGPVLKAKLLEEALEAFWAGDPAETLEEMADVLEVLRALLSAQGQDDESLQRAAASKRKKAGGFKDAVLLIETADTPLIQVRDANSLLGEVSKGRRITNVNVVIAAGRRPKTAHDRLLIPLVPPAPNELRGASTFSFRQFGITCEVRYLAKRVEVVLRREPDPMDPRQLDLPFGK